MKESARAALTFLRSKAGDFGLKEADFRKRSVHVHVPEGAIPKDGPSAGVTLAASLISAFTGIALRQDCAMTGEITLTGRVLAVGGVKEKILAAHRNKIGTVLLPKANEKDLDELPPEVREAMSFVFLENASDLIPALFPKGAFPSHIKSLDRKKAIPISKKAPAKARSMRKESSKPTPVRRKSKT